MLKSVTDNRMVEMKRAWQFRTIERFVVRDGNFVFTIASYTMILLIFVNQILIFSVALGVIASIVFFLINALFMGHALFRNENSLVRFMLGSLFQLVLLGFVGWAVMIAYNLDLVRSTIALCVLAGLASALNRIKRKSRGEMK